MTIYYVPIEPYETRYTADWISQYVTEFNNNCVKYEVITGDTVTSKILCGSVLDACGTNLYKISQLKKLINLISDGVINDGDCIFFADAWFPGVESLFYIRNLTKIDYKLFGILHAGTYDIHDFTYREGMRNWGKYLECCWLSGFDKIFVATEFHKQLIISNTDLCDLEDKIVITGLPFYAQELRSKYSCDDKQDIVVFPHRTDAEKQPELFDRLADAIHNLDSNIKCVKTLDVTKSRDEYFKLLAKSKVMVSFALQETFGYSTLESMALGNRVYVPNMLSYVETVPSEHRYDYIDIDKLANDIVNFVHNYINPNYDLHKWSKSINNMIYYMVNDAR